MSKLKVIFCGTPKIGADVLSGLIEMTNVEIVCVITQPDRLFGSKKFLTASAVKNLAQQHQIQIYQPDKISELYDILVGIEFDFLITCAYGQFIPTKILQLPKIDAINLHGSLLPKYRGGAPIQYAIKNGDRETGMSIMKMINKMDGGDYFIQESIRIEENDDAGTLFEKVGQLAKKMIKKHLFDIANHKLMPIKQNEEEVSFAKNISSNEECIDWCQSANDIVNQIRSLSPVPIAHTFMNNERYKIQRARIVDTSQEIVKMTKMIHLPGMIVAIDGEGVIVACLDSYIKLLMIQRPSKKMMSADVYYKNNLKDLEIGMVFNNDKI